MNLSRLFILRPVATTLSMLAILLAGLVAYRLLPVSALPEVDYPTIRVLTLYPGASPDVMTSAVTAPLERQFGQMPGLTQMSSTSSGGASVITLRFSLEVELDVAEPHLSGMVVADVIGGERVSTRPRSYYEAALARTFTAPLAAFIMLLLALPSAIVSERRGGGGRLLGALGLGLGFLLVDGVFSSFGSSGRLDPWLAATAAPLIFAAIGFAQLSACERA